MVLPLDAHSLYLLGVAVAVSLAVGVGFMAHQAYSRAVERRLLRTDPTQLDHRHCRYCYWGKAHLTEENVHVEGDDLVDVRCFVCRSCGLPQWIVSRTPVLRQAT